MMGPLGSVWALCSAQALSLLGEPHPLVAPASTYLPVWSDLHLQLC